jgi:hypothetical protein
MRIRINRSSISDGSRALCAELRNRGFEARQLAMEGSRFTPRADDLVINWGDCGVSRLGGLNLSTDQATNKLSCLAALNFADVWVPEFTDNRVVAEGWIAEDNTLVVCRQHLRGSSGSGIVIAGGAVSLVNAPLYTKYVKKKDEYRVHVFNGEVIDLQRKARNSDIPDEDINWQIRTHNNGFIYMRGQEGSEVSLPDDIQDMCVAAVDACDLDFGAVDIIHNEHQDKYYVLEINTAPGLTGTTLTNYADAIERYLENRYG